MIFVGSSLQKRGGIYRSFGDMVTLCEDCQWDKKFVDAGYELLHTETTQVVKYLMNLGYSLRVE